MYITTSVYFQGIVHCMNILEFFSMHLPIEKHLHYIQFLAVMKRAIVNILTQTA